jgi:prepilin-type N-terminal cleavage/methylation domain-containing protein
MQLTSRKPHSGFSLVEMAIVLAIIALLMAGLLPTLSSQIEQQKRNETRKYMDEVREALLGFVVANKRLPCPDTNGDGSENSPCTTTASQFGTLPYKDLGVIDKDPYGGTLIYAVTKAFADSSVITLSPPTAGVMRICKSATCADNWTSTAAAVIVSRGTNWALTPSTDEAENANNDTDFVSHDFTPDFDDIVVWISPNTIFSRLVAAGKLP